ncbi:MULTISPECIES: HAD family hydrolase [Hallerella]|uniref:HAD superfamily hydrolase (TIGR01509 family)/HAD superfamily hydrolase (TIGR01549 family) n=1 Tax=Hallerella succinigenes TaxID=1896222 RepID=A0A2M9A924_9BACT|nr:MULTISPECIES: HAD family hydrolase [Hallerella]MCI6873409.1 HAD family hydrolase [Hallerella sp.]MDD6092479.1 HAD family hydrolase [Hallerella succinigenes]MDY5028798.1 HAD family hydrolase [Hallerella succinigenes]PJJ42215.1 HAD superfamily hydrolase (TIGR01509 family)/HAD superfamily hydrolase (TIGR01549 family) [Hallerella succinigenes]
MEIAGVLFDLYGTLYTYGNMSKAFGLWHEDVTRALKELGISASVSQVSKQCKHFFTEPVPDTDQYTQYELRLKRLAEFFGATPDYNWIKHTAAISMNRWQRLVPIHPQTIPLLKKLKKQGLKIGVISNFQHAPHVRKVLRKHGLLKILDAVIISGEVHVRKPDPEIFKIALERLGTKAEETLFVGDDPERDIRGATSVDMQTYLFQNGSSLFDIFKNG